MANLEEESHREEWAVSEKELPAVQMPKGHIGEEGRSAGCGKPTGDAPVPAPKRAGNRWHPRRERCFIAPIFFEAAKMRWHGMRWHGKWRCGWPGRR